jgi:hypothetical protein
MHELFKIFATSCISTIKVEFHKNKLSLAQTLENILSVKGIFPLSAGIKLQMCDKRTIKAFCLKYVDFHHIFGQVMIFTKFFSFNDKSFFINVVFAIFSITGCLPQIISKS